MVEAPRPKAMIARYAPVKGACPDIAIALMNTSRTHFLFRKYRGTYNLPVVTGVTSWGETTHCRPGQPSSNMEARSG
jgi:hypothetical protein